MEPDNSTITMVPTRLGRLRVESHGSGHPAVLWHSLFVDSTSWERVREPLAASRRLLIIDGPSHGGSEPMSRRFTNKDCAEAALDVLEHFKIAAPVDWVGNAWGGHVGILFAAAHPDRCQSLVTIGTPVHALPAGERRQISAMVALYRFVGPVGPLMTAVVDGLLSPRTRATDPDAVRMVAIALRRADRRGMHAAMQSVMLARQDLTDVLPQVAAPTLIITGGDLPAFPPADAHAAAACMPHAKDATVPGTRHLIPLEAATTVVGLITDFWQSAWAHQPGPADSIDMQTDRTPAEAAPQRSTVRSALGDVGEAAAH